MNRIASAVSRCCMSQGVRKHRRASLIVIALTAAIACGEPYLHLNPYDPDFPVAIAITGPDTLFSAGELGQFAATATPTFPDTAFVWAADTVTIFQADTSYVADGSVYLTAGQDGKFQSINPPLDPATLTISVEALIGRIDTTVARHLPSCGCDKTIQTVQYRHTGLKSVVLTQRVTRIQLRCPDTHACVPVGVGGISSVWVDGFDALGHQIVALTGAGVNPDTGAVVATFVSRDSTIASVKPKGIRSANVTALKSGSTWIVATRKLLLDSLQLVVH
jgi:hypothetical protein